MGAKRNTTVPAILDSLTANDIAAKDAREAIIASIPAPIYVSRIPFKRVKRSRTLNVRDDASYGCKANPELAESLKEFGLQVRNPPMSFSLQGFTPGTILTESDILASMVEPSIHDALTISGNLRGECMEELNTAELERRAKEGITDASIPLQFAFVHGLVWVGLTTDQEKALVADQILMRRLNEFELAKAIGEFWEVTPGMTDFKMSIYWGLERNKVNRLRMRYCMPTVFDEFRREKDKSYSGPYIKVGNKDVTPLYSAYLLDRKAGCRHREEGPNFRLSWATFKADTKNFGKKEVVAESAKVQDRETVLRFADSAGATYGNTPETEFVADILRWNAGVDGARYDLAVKGLRDMCDTLRSERDSLATRCMELSDELATVKESYSAIMADRDSLSEKLAKASAKIQANGRRASK